MKKEQVDDFMNFIQLLERQRNGEHEFPDLSKVILALSLSEDEEINDTVVPLGRGQYVALISRNVFPDELDFVNKIGNFVIVIMELAHLNRVFLTRNPLVTWIIPKQ